MNKQDYKRLSNLVNEVLMDWDPICIPPGKNIESEYVTYIPLLIKNIDDKEKLFNCLEDILVNQLGLAYNSSNEEHVNDLRVITQKLNNLSK